MFDLIPSHPILEPVARASHQSPVTSHQSLSPWAGKRGWARLSKYYTVGKYYCQAIYFFFQQNQKEAVFGFCCFLAKNEIAQISTIRYSTTNTYFLAYVLTAALLRNFTQNTFPFVGRPW